MGQKVNPKIFRIGVTKSWASKWYADANYNKFLEQDIKIRKYLKVKLKEAGVASIEIERYVGKMDINIQAAKPGLIIGKGGSGVEELRKYIQAGIMQDKKIQLNLNIQEISKPNLSAEVMVQNMSLDLEKRLPYRRVLKRAIDLVRKAGAQGVKVQVSGRLNGADIARTETLTEGKIPLHTFRANIDYARGVAVTTYGAVGVKVWIYKGEVFEDEKD